MCAGGIQIAEDWQNTNGRFILCRPVLHWRRSPTARPARFRLESRPGSGVCYLRAVSRISFFRASLQAGPAFPNLPRYACDQAAQEVFSPDGPSSRRVSETRPARGMCAYLTGADPNAGLVCKPPEKLKSLDLRSRFALRAGLDSHARASFARYDLRGAWATGFPFHLAWHIANG